MLEIMRMGSPSPWSDQRWCWVCAGEHPDAAPRGNWICALSVSPPAGSKSQQSGYSFCFGETAKHSEKSYP